MRILVFVFQARNEGEKHNHHEYPAIRSQNFFDRWEIDRNEFDELMATKKESAPSPDGIPKSLYRCGEEAYSLRRNQFVFWRVILSLRCLPLFAQNRTVTDVDNNGKIVGSFEAPRPLTLRKCDRKKFTTIIYRNLQRHTMRNIHLSQRCISVRQMTDNTFENIALAHVACAPRESDILLTDFAPVVQRTASCLRWPFDPIVRWFQETSFQGTLLAWTFCGLHLTCGCVILRSCCDPTIWINDIIEIVLAGCYECP